MPGRVRGRPAGMQPGNRSGLWLNIVQAIAILRPSIVIIENVRGLLSARAHSDVEPCEVCVGDGPARRLRALGAVLGNLADLGFDAEWSTISAADAGSCHKRERVWIFAWQAAADPGSERFGEHPGESLAEEAWAFAGDEPEGDRGVRVAG